VRAQGDPESRSVVVDNVDVLGRAGRGVTAPGGSEQRALDRPVVPSLVTIEHRLHGLVLMLGQRRAEAVALGVRQRIEYGGQRGTVGQRNHPGIGGCRRERGDVVRQLPPVCGAARGIGARVGPPPVPRDEQHVDHLAADSPRLADETRHRGIPRKWSRAADRDAVIDRCDKCGGTATVHCRDSGAHQAASIEVSEV